jgi:gamma-glutamylputrescine oxidase
MLSYWEQATFLQKADLIIVGSGIVGLSAAISWKEKHPEHLVVVLERGVLPWGASTRNAGFACFGSLTELIADLDHHTEEEVIALLEQRYHGLQKLRRLLGDRRMGYQELGGYELFRAEEETIYEACLGQMDRFNQIVKDIGIHSEVFQQADKRINGFGLRQVQHLIWNAAEGQIHTGKMMEALLQLARSKGVQIYNGLEVTEMEDGGAGVRLRSANGWLWKADTVLVANNGFATQLFPDLHVLPARNQVLITEPIPRLAIKGTFHYQQGYFYFRNIDNRILLGGGRHLDPEGEQTAEFGETPQIQEALLRLLREVILPDATPAIAQRWSGILGVGDQKRPIIQLYSENIGVAVRLGGMGVAIGTEIGSRAAQMMAERGALR